MRLLLKFSSYLLYCLFDVLPAMCFNFQLILSILEQVSVFFMPLENGIIVNGRRIEDMHAMGSLTSWSDGDWHEEIWVMNWGLLHVNVMPIGAGWQTITQLEEHMPHELGQQMQPRELAVSKHTTPIPPTSESTLKAQSIWGTLEVGVASSLHPSPCFDSHESWLMSLQV